MKQPLIIRGYYQFDEQEVYVAIVLKSFWLKNLCLDNSDSLTYQDLLKIIPNGFYDLGDSLFEYDYCDALQAMKMLNNYGFLKRKIYDL